LALPTTIDDNRLSRKKKVERRNNARRDEDADATLANMDQMEPEGMAIGDSLLPPERPWIFGLLIAPMGVLSNGLIGGALFFLLLKQGVNEVRAAEIAGLLNTPQWLYFLWSPITDFWIRRRTWLMVAATAAAAVMLAAFRQPSLASPVAVTLMFLSACFGQLIVAGSGGMMGTLAREVNRRRASSFYQSGSLAFGALALSVLVALSARLKLGTLGWLMAAMIVLPSLAALAAPEQRTISGRDLAKTFAQIGVEFKGTFLHWQALPYTLVMLFPMCSGSMIQILPGLAADYHISGQQVAWINGLGGALLTAAGALAATLLSAKVRAPVAYLTAGLVNAATLALLWLGPLKPMVYLAGTVLFLFTIGACYALFTAVVLEFLGSSGESGSARYSIINSLGNVPVAYMASIDGICAGRWGARAGSGADVVLSTVGALILLAWFLSRRNGKQLPLERADAKQRISGA
jgi:PAT family beta-lactamase induction signal transducer AmpG